MSDSEHTWPKLHNATWPGLVDAFPDGRELHFSDRTHFLPQEDPAGMAALILEHDAWIRGDSA